MSSSHQKFLPNYAAEVKALARFSRLHEALHKEIMKYWSPDGEFVALDKRYRSAKTAEIVRQMSPLVPITGTLLKSVEKIQNGETIDWVGYTPYDGFSDVLPLIHEAHDDYFEYVTAQYKTIELTGEKESNGEFKDYNQVYLDDENLQLDPLKLPPIKRYATVCAAATPNTPQRIACTVGYDYSKTKFVYADDGSPIDGGGILFWTYNSTYDYTKESNETNRHQAYRLSQGLTSPDGLLVEKGHPGLETLNAERAKEDPDLAPLFEENPNHVRYHQSTYTPFEDSTPLASKKGFSAKSSKADNFAFMLYPADGGEFISKPLSELITMKTPSGAQVVFTDNSQSAPAEVRLHCTLPQWNKRLQKAVVELNKQVLQYSTIIAPHEQKKRLLQSMSEIVELHCQHEYIDFDDLVKNADDNPHSQEQINSIIKKSRSKNQEENRHKLLQNIADLDSGITHMVSSPTAENPITKPYHMEQQHIVVASDKLWSLFSSPAFKDELSHYLEYVNTLDEDALVDDIPAGPYMQDLEQGWDDIFITIAECYAALSNTEKYREILWEKDIKSGIEWLCQLDPDDALDQAMVEQISDFNPDNRLSHDSAHDEARSDIPAYQRPLAKTIQAVIKEGKTHKSNSIFATLLKDGLKPILSHVIPGIGAPCSLQVILALFDDEIVEELSKDTSSGKDPSAPKDRSRPTRFCNNVIKIMLGCEEKAKLQERVKRWEGKLQRAKSGKRKAKAKRSLERAQNKLAAANKMELADEDLTRQVAKSLVVSKNKEAAVKRIKTAKTGLRNRINAIAAQLPKQTNSPEPPFKLGGWTEEEIKERLKEYRKRAKNAKTKGNIKEHTRRADRAEAKLEEYRKAKLEHDKAITERKAKAKAAQAAAAKTATAQADKQLARSVTSRVRNVDFSGTATDSSNRGTNAWFYGKFDNKLGGTAKVVYQWYNFALQVNNVQTELEKDTRREKTLKEYVKTSTEIINLGCTSTTAVLSVSNWIARFDKNTTRLEGILYPSEVGKKAINGILDRASILVGLITTITSGYEAIEHFKDKDYEKAARASLDTIASGLVTVGFMTQYLSKRGRNMGLKLATRTALRFARTLAVTGLTAATGVGVIFAPFILVVGTVVNVCLAIWDILSMISDLRTTPAEVFLESAWKEFKKELSKEQVAELRTIYYVDDRHYYSRETLGDKATFFDRDPYALYSDKYDGAKWPSDADSQAITVKPTKNIDDLHEHSFLELDSVELGKLSWRAVIPLYKLGFSAEQIDVFVKIKSLQNAPGLISLRQPLNTCAQDIIDYYESARAELFKLQDQLVKEKELTQADKALIQQQIRDQFYLGESQTSIILALETGDFTAPEQVILGHLDSTQKAEVTKDYQRAFDADQSLHAKIAPNPNDYRNQRSQENGVNIRKSKGMYLKRKAQADAHNQRLADYQKAKQSGQAISDYKDLAAAEKTAKNYQSNYQKQCTLYKWQAWADLVYTLPAAPTAK
ncbi:hypothetical protein [Marinagarivorans cellulosilyticus]|uniref:Uncharacterized protein n=1 Tax=Marinagarivorans cellulosilyticus TaxID=2721545 RepID=A0AAN1WKY1_9GAMM|nr:hypothetical protein [Marinagarivorans cellulosilyticus]BCD99508.1 hypothetical protein MARGE09_P3710 [Marinagarivorans cellulosilyticus]